MYSPLVVIPSNPYSICYSVQPENLHEADIMHNEVSIEFPILTHSVVPTE
jgi:hypothetical protein